MDSSPHTTGFLIVDLARLFRQHFEHAVAEEGLGVTAGEARTLLYAAAENGVRQAVLAERMRIEPMTLSNFVDRLEECGLVRRELDQRDRRARIVRVTQEAAPLLKRIHAVAAAVRERATAGLTPAEEATLRHALQTMWSNLSGAARERTA